MSIAVVIVGEDCEDTMLGEPVGSPMRCFRRRWGAPRKSVDALELLLKGFSLLERTWSRGSAYHDTTQRAQSPRR